MILVKTGHAGTEILQTKPRARVTQAGRDYAVGAYSSQKQTKNSVWASSAKVLHSQEHIKRAKLYHSVEGEDLREDIVSSKKSILLPWLQYHQMTKSYLLHVEDLSWLTVWWQFTLTMSVLSDKNSFLVCAWSTEQLMILFAKNETKRWCKYVFRK